jgi:hypothetical protein
MILHDDAHRGDRDYRDRGFRDDRDYLTYAKFIILLFLYFFPFWK